MKVAYRFIRAITEYKAVGIWLALIPPFFMLARRNYLLFHTMAEGFAIIVAALIYVLGTRTYRHSGNNFLLFLGNAYFFVAVLDFFHLITYKGVGVLPGYGPNTPTQLWIAGRYVEGLSLFLAPLFGRRKVSRTILFLVYTVAACFLLASIMWLRIFPVCYVDGKGLTTFKVASEYTISLTLLGAIIQLYFQHKETNHSLYMIMMAAMISTILSELSFTLYVDVYGVMNFVGHIFKIISYYLVYWGVVLRGLEAPYDMIFEELQARVLSDSLTGLYNRQGFAELARKELARAQRKGTVLGVLLMDIDNFKKVNDRYGHLVGDRVLKHFASIVRESIRETDVACRWGGDEFVVLASEVDQSKLDSVRQRIRRAAQEWTASDEITRELGLSIGSALWEPGCPEDIDALLSEADRKMYLDKKAKEYRISWC